ncbi:unnamed protein product [Victoria cruziana]
MMAAATATVFYPLRPPASIGALSSSARLKQPTSSGGYRGNDAGLVTVAVFSRRTAIIFVTSTLSSIIAPPFISATQAEEMDDEDEESMATRVFEETSSSVVAIKDVEILQPGNAGDQIRLVNDETIRIEGTGSGFFWDEVTNYHVIAKLATDMSGRQKCKVLLLDADNNTIVKEGRLVGFDAAYDLAVLKVDVEDGKLKPALLGTSQDLLVGQSCFAIGNPYGYEHTLTAGVVSGLGREIPSPSGRPILGAVQTDATINPGNSGGPLLDSHGHVIGVNTATFTRKGTGLSSGVNFAVPIDIVRKIVPELIAYGSKDGYRF